MKARLLWISCFSYGSIAFTLVILGAMLPELLAHYSQSYSDGGVLVFSQFTSFLIGVLGCTCCISSQRQRFCGICALLFDRAVYGRNVRDCFDHYQSVFPRENGADDKYFACFQWARRRNAADRHGGAWIVFRFKRHFGY